MDTIELFQGVFNYLQDLLAAVLHLPTSKPEPELQVTA
jgi:hypothetical protein